MIKSINALLLASEALGGKLQGVRRKFLPHPAGPKPFAYSSAKADIDVKGRQRETDCCKATVRAAPEPRSYSTRVTSALPRRGTCCRKRYPGLTGGSSRPATHLGRTPEASPMYALGMGSWQYQGPHYMATLLPRHDYRYRYRSVSGAA